MKGKIINFLLLISSLFGYLEWGNSSHAFLFQTEMEIFSKFISDPLAVLHPLIIIPIAGQAMLLWTLFQKIPGKKITWIGIGSLGLLFFMLLIVGILGSNIKTILSTIPFIALAAFAVNHYINGSDYSKS